MSDQHDGPPPSADENTPAPHDADSFASHDALSESPSSSDPLASGSYDSGTLDPASTLPQASNQEASSDADGASTNRSEHTAPTGGQNAPAPMVPSAPESPADATATLSAPAGEPRSDSTPVTKSRIPPLVKRIGIVLLILIIGFVVRSAFNRSSADVLEVGQCVSRDGDSIDQIDCNDEKARYKVLVIKKDTTKSSIQTVCSKSPGATTSYFESKEKAKTGNIICLGPVK